MKIKSIRFFSPNDNQVSQSKKKKAVSLKGYVSSTGRLVFPKKTTLQLGWGADQTRFKIGTQVGKRQLEALYLVPAEETQTEAFSVEKKTNISTIKLESMLQKGGLDYRTKKWLFHIVPFQYEAGVTAYVLELEPVQ